MLHSERSGPGATLLRIRCRVKVRHWSIEKQPLTSVSYHRLQFSERLYPFRFASHWPHYDFAALHFKLTRKGDNLIDGHGLEVDSNNLGCLFS